MTFSVSTGIAMARERMITNRNMDVTLFMVRLHPDLRGFVVSAQPNGFGNLGGL